MTLSLRQSCPRRPQAARRALLPLTAGLIAFACNTIQAGPVNTAVYTTYTDNFPTGVHFTGTPVDNISTPDFDQFGSAVSWRWHPDALKTFAADTLGYIQVPTADSFTFILAGAQMEYAFVDGVLTVTHGSDSVSQSQNTIPLAAGLHSIEVQYDIVKPTDQFPADVDSGYELTISPASGFSIVPAPEPTATTLLLFATAAALLPRKHRPR